jgi:hypothetical protein
VGRAVPRSVQPRPSGSTVVRTAINAQSPSARTSTIAPAPAGQPRRGFHVLSEGFSPHKHNRARIQRRVDRNLFRSPRGARSSQECSTSSIRFNRCENCYKCSISISPHQHNRARSGGSAPQGLPRAQRGLQPAQAQSRPNPAEGRPKFISVTAWGAQFPGVFNLVHQAQPLTLVQVCRVAQSRPNPAEGRPKFISVTAWGAQFPGVFNLVHQAQPLTLVQVCRVAQDARIQRSVDRNLVRSPRGARSSQECSTSSIRLNR